MFSLQLEKHHAGSWQRKCTEVLSREIFLTAFSVQDSDLELWRQKCLLLFHQLAQIFTCLVFLLKVPLYSLCEICFTRLFCHAKIFQNSMPLVLVYLCKQQRFGWLEMQTFATAKNQSEKQTQHIYIRICYAMFV